MSNAVDQFLDEIALEAAKRLTTDQGHRLLDEVKAHLDEELRARLEFGMEEAEAARQAILTFGSPQKVVNEVAKVHPRDEGVWFSRSFLFGCCVATLVAASFPYLPGSNDSTNDWIGVSAFVASLLFGGWLGLLSWRARKLQFPALAILFTVCTVVPTLFNAYTKVYFSDPYDSLTRPDAVREVTALRGQGRVVAQELATFRKNYQQFQVADLNLMPRIPDARFQDPPLSYEPVVLESWGNISSIGRPDALRRWEKVRTEWIPRFEERLREIDGRAMRIEAGLQTPWIGNIEGALPAASLNAFAWTFLLALLNGTVSLARFLFESVTRWGPKARVR